MAKKPATSSKSKTSAAPATAKKPALKPATKQAERAEPAKKQSLTAKTDTPPKSGAKPTNKPGSKAESPAPKSSQAPAKDSKPAAKPAPAKESKGSPAKEPVKGTKPVGSSKPDAKPEALRPSEKGAGTSPIAPGISVKPTRHKAGPGITIKSPAGRATAPKPAPKTPPKLPSSLPKSKAPPAPSGPPQKYNVMSSDAMAAGRAAAAKLAAAAGLQPAVSTANGDTKRKELPRLTKSPFTKKELDDFREILLAKRAQLVGDVSSMESEALTGGVGGSLSHLPQHMADQGTDTFDQALALDLVASQRGLVKEIDDALARIANGTFGICEELGKAITTERLKHTPWARYSIEAARQHERAGYFK